ncbi:unnamed protein product [Blepharisma stoltei]|uniref:Uncharacterized protein n=1 Tax=Blepharisma stoltei TaxID=1481888 RepID=A0AAU9JXW3_9CILI|nr:unnamed protein product [Blepharisma stoltei]
MKPLATQWRSKLMLFLPIKLTFVCLSIMIVSILQKQWATVKTGDESYHMNFLRCTNCKLWTQDWSWRCFRNYMCESDPNLGNCAVYSDGWNATKYFLILEILAFIFGLVLLEKLILAYRNKYFGNTVIVHLAAASMALFHTGAVYVWFSLNHTSWIRSHTNRPHVVAKNGPKLALINTFFAFSAFISVLYLLKKHGNETYASMSLDTKIGKKTAKYWLKLSGALFILGFLSHVIVLGIGRWALRYTFENDTIWQGGLLNCYYCEEGIDNIHWDCLASVTCHFAPNSGTCDFYKDLWKASVSYIIFILIALINFILLAQSFYSILKRRDYGIPFLNYLYAVLLCGFNLIAAISYIWISQAKMFSIECSERVGYDDRPALCPTGGPYTILGSNLFTLPATVIFLIVYYRRVEVEYEMKLEESVIDMNSEDSGIELNIITE